MSVAPAILSSQASRRRAVQESFWLPTQERWINDASRKKIWEKCRRYGGSFAESFAATTRAGLDTNKCDAWISSRDMLAARLFTEDVKKWVRKINAAFEDCGEVLVSDPKSNLRAYAVEFANGRRLHSLSSSPDAIAGKEGHFTKDEAALHKDLRQWYAIAQPAIMRKGSMSYISTHRGNGNFFNTLIQEIKHKGNPKGFSLHSINIEQGVQEGLWLKILQDLGPEDERYNWTDDDFLQSLRDECADEEAWKQEFLCIPCDDAESLITWEDITACTESAEQKQGRVLDAGANRYSGQDVARRKHLSVLITLADYLGQLVFEDMLVMQNEPFAKQELALFAAIERSVSARIDATGLGMQMAENAQTKYPHKARGLMLSAPEKLRLAVQLQRVFQDRRILIPDDHKLHYDIYSVKKHVSAGGMILLKSEGGSTDGHSDRFWALALAVDAALSRPKVQLYGALC